MSKQPTLPSWIDADEIDGALRLRVVERLGRTESVVARLDRIEPGASTQSATVAVDELREAVVEADPTLTLRFGDSLVVFPRRQRDEERPDPTVVWLNATALSLALDHLPPDCDEVTVHADPAGGDQVGLLALEVADGCGLVVPPLQHPDDYDGNSELCGGDPV